MNVVLIFLICVVVVAFTLFGVLDTEPPRNDVGVSMDLKPGIKVNEKYCYDTSTNSYVICF